jgi:hypothetical protein
MSECLQGWGAGRVADTPNSSSTRGKELPKAPTKDLFTMLMPEAEAGLQCAENITAENCQTEVHPKRVPRPLGLVVLSNHQHPPPWQSLIHSILGSLLTV